MNRRGLLALALAAITAIGVALPVAARSPHVVGMIPIIGEPADLLNGAIYASEGDYLNSMLSFSSAIPAVGNAVGAAKLAAKHGDEVLDAAGTLAGKADEIAGAGAKQSDEVADAATSCATKHSFSPTTPVQTSSGDIPIAELEVGETVTARDPDTGEVAEHTVTAVHINADPEILHLSIDGETIDTTPEHLFLTDQGWVEAAALWPGTRVQKLDGSFGTVEGYSVDVRPVIIWDLTVSGVHTFAVGAGDWLVHNCDDIVPAELYRNASGTPQSMTPRPIKDEGGLTAWDTVEGAGGSAGDKIQVIDTSKFDCLCARADGGGHYSIVPKDPSQMAGWIATRGTDTVHALTQELLGALKPFIRVNK